LSTTNQDIVELFAKGDRLAFDALFRMHYRDLCRYAMFLSLSADDAEDLVQDIFFRLWEGRQNIKFETSPKSYLFTSVKNRVLNELKHQKVKLKYVQDEGISDAESELENDNHGDFRLSLLRDAIAQLPEKRREIFVLNKIEGIKYKDIAEKLGISVKTVENQMGEALKFLRGRFDNTEISIIAFCFCYKYLYDFLVGVFNEIIVLA
jgi:RNA polymerase sigma-70 factor (ECF subfamily)